MRKILTAAAAAAALACTPAVAAIDVYTAFLYGSNEVGGGDVDGFGVASVEIDNATNMVSWSIMARNILFPLSGAHIHQAPFGVNGPVVIDFGGQLTGSNLVDTDAAMINSATATGFYVNLHNSVFPGGAIRGQMQYVGTAMQPIPEPGTYGMMLGGLGVVALLMRRRRPDDRG